MSVGEIAVVAVLVLAWSAMSRPLGRHDVTAPMAFVTAGLLLGGPALLDLGLGNEAIKLVAEATLVLVLFSDAARVDLSSLRRDVGLPARLLIVGLPLTVLAGMGAVWLLVPGVGVWPAALVAACLAPTDAGLGAGLVSDTRLPSRIRRTLNVESGVNDGLIAPFVTLAIAVVVGESTGASDFAIDAVQELATGAAVGVLVGLGGGWVLRQAARRHWVEPGAAALASVALAAGAYAGALAVHGNGFVAAFLAGLCFGPFRRALEEDALELAEGAGQLLGTVVWFSFGATMLLPALEDLSWRLVLYAALSLTVVRMVPVALSLLGSGLDRGSVLLVGWFGPRGLASVIFALLAFDEIGATAEPVVTVVSLTVVLSVLAHGASASPLISRYAARARSLPSDAPVLQQVPVPEARRALGRRTTP